MLMDYKNSLGKGSTALYWTSPRRQYYLYVDSSFQNWISNHVQMLEKNFMQKDDLGRITTFLNADEIFKDYINQNKFIYKAYSNNIFHQKDDNEIEKTIDKSTLE